MDTLKETHLKDKLLPLAAKYRIPLLFLCCGLILVFFPKQKQPSVNEKEDAPAFSLEETRTQMEDILAQIDGVGNLRLMLTLRTGCTRQYLQDVRTTTQSESGTKESTTVFQNTTNTSKAPIVTVQTYPQYQGALVICSGADRAGVRLAVKEAVSSLTGLGSDKISVIKMKEQ